MLAFGGHLLAKYAIKYHLLDSPGKLAAVLRHMAIEGSLPVPEPEPYSPPKPTAPVAPYPATQAANVPTTNP